MSLNVKKLEDLQAELAKLQLEEEKVKEKESQLKKENREKPEKKVLPSPVDWTDYLWLLYSSRVNKL